MMAFDACGEEECLWDMILMILCTTLKSFFRAEIAALVNIAEGPNLAVVQEARAHFILLKESRLSHVFSLSQHENDLFRLSFV